MSRFESDQRNYYTSEINRAFPASRANNTIAAALGIVDPQTTATYPTHGPNLVSNFGRESPAIKRDEACRGLPAPTPSMRDPSDRTGCGWWFTPNPAIQSVGAYGSRRGPMSPTLDRDIGTGQWVWDVQQAMQMEGAKQSAKIQACPDLQFSQFPNMGWCPSTNRAVVTDGNGNPAFPQSAGGDCPGGGIITSYQQCPPPPSDPSNPSSQNPGVVGICQPDGNGALSPACLQSIVNQSCSSTGTMSLALGSGYASSYAPFNDVNAVLAQRGFNIPSGIVNDGRMSVQDALGFTNTLRAAAGAGDQSRTTMASKNLCYGTPFDPCAFQPSDTGPFPPQCITKAALAMGYSANAGLLPANIGMGYWNQYYSTWQQVLDGLTWWKSTADTPQSQPNLQANGIANVYGTTIKYPKQGCNNAGVMMYRYYFPGFNQELFPAAGPHTHFMGRYMFKNGFPKKLETTEDQTPAGGFLTEGQRYIANFIPIDGGTYQFFTVSDDNMRIFIDDQLVLPWSFSNGVSQTIQMVPGQVYKIVVDLWNGGGPWAFILQMSVNQSPWQDIPPTQLFMTQDRRLPTFELAFNQMPVGTTGVIQDTNSVFQNLEMIGASVGSLNGKQCMVVNGWNSGVFGYATYSQGIRARAFKSYTMMVQVNSATRAKDGGFSSLFSFYNTSDSNVGYPRTGAPSVSWDYPYRRQDLTCWTYTGNIVFQYTDRTITQSANSALAPLSYGQWVHVAIVWNEDFSGFTTYLNGAVASQAIINGPPVTTLLEQLRIGSDGTDDGQSWSGGMAWFRGFDYQLSADLVTRDMNDDWANLV